MAGPRSRAPASALPRKRPLQKRATLTIDAIVGAVERILDREGFAGLTTNRVAEVAGVSVGSLYQYYPNKQALIRAVHERYLEQTLGACRALLAATDGVPIADVIARVTGALVATRELQRPIHDWLIELRSVAELQAHYRETFAAFADECACFLASRPDVRFADPAAAAWVVVHAIEGIVQAVAARGRSIDVEPIAAAAAAMIGAYFAAASPA
jgi:AcrR family transcriptional regulator